MKLLRAVCVSFSMYSGIPVPQFPWKDDDMKYILCFFPWVGAVCGVCLYLWGLCCRSLGIGTVCYTMVGAAIPLFVTGGFHVDGFMDTMDAFHSWKPREEKLKILKDSHIGAFSVIMLSAFGLLWLGAFSELNDPKLLAAFCGGFVLSRCLSGIAVVSFPSAKSDGLLYTFASGAQKTVVKTSLYLQGAAAACFMIAQSHAAGFAAVLTALAVFGYYYRRCKKEFGGITGDTAGYFVCLSEECMLLVIVFCGLVRREIL